MKTVRDYKAKIAELNRQIKALQLRDASVYGRGYQDGYNIARREISNTLRELAGLDPL